MKISNIIQVLTIKTTSPEALALKGVNNIQFLNAKLLINDETSSEVYSQTQMGVLVLEYTHRQSVGVHKNLSKEQF